MNETLDVVVVGAGAVGLAVAARLARPGRKVAVLERNARHGLETSSRSSEVIHSGIYYPTDSLKARLCVAGRRRLYAWLDAGRLPARRTGKLIVAVDQKEAAALQTLHKRGQDNGVEGLTLLEGRDVPRYAAGVKACAALWSAETGIMDTEALMGLYLRDAEDNGAMVVCGAPLEGVEKTKEGYLLRLGGSGETVSTRRVVNAAGLACDRVAALAGLDVDALGYRLSWFKGEYFSLSRSQPPRCLVYPLPGPHGLGVHLTLDLQGRQRLGPNAFPVDTLDYDVDAAHASRFFESARVFLPDLRAEDLQPGTSGIRPKLSAKGEFRDFVIAEESARGLPGWVNLIGIESPGLTASPAIADFVGDLLEWPA